MPQTLIRCLGIQISPIVYGDSFRLASTANLGKGPANFRAPKSQLLRPGQCTHGGISCPLNLRESTIHEELCSKLASPLAKNTTAFAISSDFRYARVDARGDEFPSRPSYLTASQQFMEPILSGQDLPRSREGIIREQRLILCFQSLTTKNRMALDKLLGAFS